MDDSTPHSNMMAAHALWRVLARARCRHVVLSPGARSAPLVLALAAYPNIEAHVVLDERAAGFVALGLAKAMGQAAVLVCTSGSAGGHYLPAVMEAFHDGVPLVVVTADRPSELAHQGAAQTTEQEGLYSRHVLAARGLPTPRSGAACSGIVAAWQHLVGQMLDVAEGAPSGPVHINAPFAEPLVPAPEALVLKPDAAVVRASVQMAQAQPSAAGYEQICAWLGPRRRGVIVCGPLPAAPLGAPRIAAVLALAEALGWPILADPLSGLRHGVPDQKQRWVLAHYDRAYKTAAQGAPPAADGVLCLGRLPTSKALQKWTASQQGAGILSVTEPGRPGWADPIAELLVPADVETLCGILAARVLQPLHAQDPAPQLAAWRAWQQSAERTLSPDNAPGLCGRTLWPALMQALPAGGGLHVGSSMPIRDLDAWAPTTSRALRLTSSRGLNGIDGFIATLSGLALGDKRPWFGVLGDLTFLHDVGALQAARQLGVRATLVVCHNGGGQIFGHLPLAQHTQTFERFFRTPQLADIGQVCAACACSHEVVYTPETLRQAVQAAMAQNAEPKLHVIEARYVAEGVQLPRPRRAGNEATSQEH